MLFFLMIAGAASPAHAAAKKDNPQKPPKFPRKSVWLNVERPLSKKAFEEKITLVYFWDYTSVNCLRELPILKRWYQRYHPYSFEMIFIHAPEFDFAQEKSNVEQAVKRLQIPFPVVLDNRFKLWDGYGARSWPTKYLVNLKGVIVHAQVGEGGYLATEEKIREELKKLDGSIVLPIPVLEKEPAKFSIRECGPMSAETYMGHKRAGWWGGEIANARGVLPDETMLFHDKGKRVERGFFAEGLWANREDYFEHARDTAGLKDYVGLLYLANEVYAVMNQMDEGEVSRVYVTRDEQPVPPVYRGSDLHEDASGGTYFLLQEPRLYYLIAKDEEEPHELKLWTQKKGTAFSSLSFSNHCLSEFDHL